MSIWQSKSWGKFLVSAGQAQEVFDVDWIQVEKRSVGLWEYGLFILWITPTILSKKALAQLEKLCTQQNALFIQIETLDYNSKISFDTHWKKKYYKKFITPYTAVIDLTKTEDDILAAMKPKGRYNIKLATKKWVEIITSSNSDSDIKSFYEIMQETTSRDSFAGNSLDYYKKFLSKNKNSKLLLATKDNVIIAAGIFIFEKNVSIYYYWASTSDKQYRNLMAPYLLQWEAISIAKRIGSKLYDFLWVAHPDDTNSSLLGVTSFKKKLTPDIRRVSEGYIYVNKKLKYSFIQILRKLKK